MMGIVVPETCWAYKKCNKIISSILLVVILQTPPLLTTLSQEDTWVRSKKKLFHYLERKWEIPNLVQPWWPYSLSQHPRKIMATPAIPWSQGGRSRVCCWPARGSDLTPFGFYLWGRLKALVNVDGRVLYITRKLFVEARDVIVPDTKRVCRLGMSSASVRLSCWWTRWAVSFDTVPSHYFSEWFWTWWTSYLINTSTWLLACRGTFVAVETKFKVSVTSDSLTGVLISP